MCSSQVQPGKEVETFHWAQCKGPRRTGGQQVLFTEGTANLFFQHGAQHFQGGNLPHDFPVPSRRELYQTRAPSCIQMRRAIPRPPLLLSCLSVYLSSPSCLILCSSFKVLCLSVPPSSNESGSFSSGTSTAVFSPLGQGCLFAPAIS